MNRMLLPLLAAFLCILQPAGAETPDGQALFERYGCTNCHGPHGIHPTALHAPVLRGKPADYLLERAESIFGGGGRTSAARFMHEQFCVDETPAEGCYPVPDKDELRVIAQWLAGDGPLPAKKRTPQGLYATSVEAYEALRAQKGRAVLIDVRTRAEVAFLSMPEPAAANIPYMLMDFDEWDEKRGTFRMVPNSAFTQQVNDLVKRLGLSKDDPIYLICRSGSRSARAAKLLHANGYTQVYTITDGFEGDKATDGPHKGQRVVNGWKNVGLPWTYKLKKEAMYLTF